MKIKDRMKQFGILVIRLIWPDMQKKNVQRLGVLMLGIAMLLSVTQANTVQRRLLGATHSETSGQILPSETKAVATTNAVRNAAGTDYTEQVQSGAAEGQNTATNIVNLIGESELILRGSIKEVTDGIEDGVPYTQVTVQVSEALRGQFGNEYTFRQFGMLQPRKMGNGKINLNVTPDGWSKYKEGEEVVLFLYKQASITALRTTVGLGQGKIEIKGGNVSSQFDNAGLFDNVEVDAKLLNERNKRLLATKKGPVNKESFMSFVRTAVKDKWIEGGKLRNAKK